MMRSLFTGVSGMRNHQVKMDVIGNNLANINTVGFKAGRVTFSEALALTLQGSKRPTGSLGGVNPMQIGLGMTVGMIDSAFNQGGLETTNVQSHLAINGDGFFIVNDGERDYYTRAGSFQFDANGTLVNTSDGKVVQGKMADANGVISSGTVVQDIKLPFGQQVAANATEKVDFIGNLNAGEFPVGTIIDSGVILAVEEAGDGSDINGLFAKGAANSTILGVNHGLSTITVKDGTKSEIYTYVELDTGGSNNDFNSLDDLITEITNGFAGSLRVSLDSNGAIVVEDLSGSAQSVSFSADNPTLHSALSSADGIIDSSSGLTTKTDEFSHNATATEELTKLRNSLGNSMGLTAGDTINISGKVGETNLLNTFSVLATSTLNDLTTQVKNTLGLTNSNAVTIDSDGSLKISGDPGEENAVTNVGIRASGNSNLNTTMTFTENQKAKDITHSSSITVYDALGEVHVLTMTFTKSSIPNVWEWQAALNGDETIAAGNKGNITFNSDGSLNTFTYENGVSAFEFNPGTGADIMKIQFQMGDLGGFSGVTQFSSSSTLVAKGQDGYTNGNLVDLNIDNTGTITGVFSNGINQTLAQIALAKFNNPNGLYREGNNMYAQSTNSGIPIVGTAGDNIESTIIPGNLEMSNVNLAQEFTDMILAQRGFQANARVITTSDDLLNELVNLKR